MSTALTSTVAAGGFSRGVADTDILFDRGTILLGGADLSARAGVTVVNPKREYQTIRPLALTRGNPATPAVPIDGFENPSYVVPSAAFKIGVGDRAACSGAFSTPFGGNSSYAGARFPAIGPGAPTGGVNPASELLTVSQEFITKEYALTCLVGTNVGRGRAFALGGGFVQTLDYEQIVAAGAQTLALEDTGYGYRLGVGYEIPEIALRAQLVYRSEVDVDATGTFSGVTFRNAPAPDGIAFNNTDASGNGTFPRSLELKLQSGIAEGTLAFLNIRWTDWSVFDQLSYSTGTPSFVPGAARAEDDALDFFYRDGYTISAGIGRQLNETTAASLAIGWDRGVGTGYDISTDTWTLAAGASFTPRDDIEIRAGGALLYLTEGEQCFFAGLDYCSAALGDEPVITADNDVGFALSLSGKLKF